MIAKDGDGRNKGGGGAALAYLLLQVVEKITIEEGAQGDAETVTQFFERYDPRILALFVQHTVNGGGRDARKVGEGVHGNIPLVAKR